MTVRQRGCTLPAMPSPYRNELGQAVGRPLPDWKSVPPPSGTQLAGRYCRLESLNAPHIPDLFEAFAKETDGSSWTYQPYGPFADVASLQRWVAGVKRARDTLLYAVIDSRVNKARGMAAYMSLKTSHGSIEIGHIHYGPAMRRTSAGSEAIILLMRHVFSLGYRRLEWRCHAQNEPSRRAAERMGFTLEGIFRNSSVQKGRNRDTAWYSVIDEEWPAIDRVLDGWLSLPDNPDGTKNQHLSEMMAGRERNAPGGVE